MFDSRTAHHFVSTLPSFLAAPIPGFFNGLHSAVLRGNAIDLIREANVDHQRLNRFVSCDALQIAELPSVDQIVRAEEVANSVDRQIAVLADPYARTLAVIIERLEAQPVVSVGNQGRLSTQDSCPCESWLA
jgi:hypothetical protein